LICMCFMQRGLPNGSPFCLTSNLSTFMG